MNVVLKKQLDEMTDSELKYLLKRDYLRRLTRYRMTDDYYRAKYEMDFDNFEKANIVRDQNYSFEVESHAQEWELAIDGIKTIKKKLFGCRTNQFACWTCLGTAARLREDHMPVSMLDRQMNKLEMEKTILEESKGLSISALREILDFMRFIKSKRMNEGRMEPIDNVKRELSELDKASLTHLEAEFKDYKELYPYEQ